MTLAPVSRRRTWSAISMLLLTGLLLPASGAAAQAREAAPDSLSKPDRDAFFGLRPAALVSTGNLLILGTGSLAAAVSWDEFDENFEITQKALDNSVFDGLLDVGNVYGSGWFIGAGSAGLLAAGQISGHRRMTALGGDLLRSFTYSGLAVWILKYSFNRDRPSGGPYSFPSGHTTSAFSTVPVIWYHLGWGAGTLAGAVSVMTGLGRMEEYRHYLSDIVFGAALGLVFGRAVIDHRRQNDLLAHLVVTSDSVALRWNF